MNSAASKARVLFVDDERRVLNSMRGMFRRDFDLFLTTEGATAVEIARKNPIDVIVADQRMPGMSGIEVLGKVRELSPDTIRILLTGYADPSAVQGSINVGEVFRFLGKPCPPTLLRETLDLAIRANRRASAAKVRPVLEPEPRRDSRQNEPAEERGGNSERLLSRLRAVGDVSYSLEHYRKRRGPGAEKPERRDSGVVLYTVDPKFAELALRSLTAEHNVTLATSLIKVMQAVEQKCEVLVTDISANCLQLQKIIAALKQMRPELVTVVVSDTRDTTDMVRLINYGQIFRFVQKPVETTQLQQAVKSAAEKNAELEFVPGAVHRHTVATPGAMDSMDSVIRQHAQH